MNATADLTVHLNLPAIRRNRGLTLQAIAQETKIRKAYLEAIEAEEFASLPGDIYARSYIRQYARAIDFDENAILSLYCAQCPPPPQVEEVPEPTAGEALLGLVRMLGWR